MCMDLSPKIFLHKIPEGYRGTLQTVGHIGDLIKQGAKDFHVRQTAIGILLQRSVKAKDYLGEIKALFEWVQQHVRYSKDPYRVEVFIPQSRMLDLRAGDCDDMAILLGAMLEVIGHPVRLVLTGPDPLRPDLFTHIYLEVFHKGRWIPLDATMPYPMGWGPGNNGEEDNRNRKEAEHDARGPGNGKALVSVGAVPDWLRGLVRPVRTEAIRPKDAKGKVIVGLAAATAIARRKAHGSKRYCFVSGTGAYPLDLIRVLRRRIKQTLRLWGDLAVPISAGCAWLIVRHSVRPVTRAAFQAVRPVAPQTTLASLRPAAMQPVRPVQMKPAGIKGARKMSCRCETCSGDGRGNTSPMGQTAAAMPIQAPRRGLLADLVPSMDSMLHAAVKCAIIG